MGLFQRGLFRLHSGATTGWKINCDALTEEDLTTLAYLIAQKVGAFSQVEGVPTGGLGLAQALETWQSETGPLLIVDDVCTTGASLEDHRAGRAAIGYVIFARGPVPPWVRSLFTLA